MNKVVLTLLALFAAFQISGCAAAIGAGGVIVADEVLEDQNGDDGLF
ncbi:MAG: hypothetical protein AAFR98_13410 [Pseudomonadota bacterium]